MSHARARLTRATLTALALSALAVPSLAAPASAVPVTSAGVVAAKPSIRVAVSSASVQNHSAVGPVEVIRFSVTNDGRYPVRSLYLKAPTAGLVEADRSYHVLRDLCGLRAGEQLAPGRTVSCTVRRHLGAHEQRRGLAAAQHILVTAFGGSGSVARPLTVPAKAFDRGLFSPAPAPSPSPAPEAEASVTSLGVERDPYYGPVEKLSVWVKNTSKRDTKYLDLQTPDGKVYVDEEGEQMWIGDCRPRAYPLQPGTSTTCTALRRLTDDELKLGRTTPQDLVVLPFGKDGFKVTGLKTGSVPFDAYRVRQEARAKVTSAGVENDPYYGPVEKLSVWVENLGEVDTKYLDLQTPDGKVYVDEEGEQMWIGDCRPRAYPLQPGTSTTCTALRRLTDAELAAGRTTPQQLVVVPWGKDGFKVGGLQTTATVFDARALRS